MPILGRVWVNRLYVPPYRLDDETMLSPARARLRIDSVSAAWPEREAEGGDAALERGDALLEDVGRRVHDPGVDVPELLEPEEPRRVRRVVEDVAGRGVDRDGPGVRRRVRLLAGVEGPGLGAEGGRIELGHVDGSPAGVLRWLMPCEVPALGGLGGSAVTRRVVRRKQKSRSSSWNCSPGTSSVVPRLPSGVRVTSDPILRTAGPPAHTHVPGDLGVSHGPANGRPMSRRGVNRTETQRPAIAPPATG